MRIAPLSGLAQMVQYALHPTSRWRNAVRCALALIGFFKRCAAAHAQTPVGCNAYCTAFRLGTDGAICIAPYVPVAQCGSVRACTDLFLQTVRRRACPNSGGAMRFGARLH